MSRHSKNNTSTSVFTYRERQMIKDYGTQKARIGLDSCKKFDECTLCLLKAQDPYTCQEGHIFCKACIIESMVEQKKDIASKIAQYQQNILQEKKNETQEQNEKQKDDISKFISTEDNRIVSSAETIKFKGKKISSFISI